MNIVWAKHFRKFSLGILKTHDPKKKKKVIFKLCFLFNSIDVCMNMIVLKVYVSAGSESAGSRLMWGDEVLGSRKHTMRKKFLTFFTAQMYEPIIQCTGLNASSFCLVFKELQVGSLWVLQPSERLMHISASTMVTEGARAVECSPSVTGWAVPNALVAGCDKLSDLLQSCLWSVKNWQGFLRTRAKAPAFPALGWRKA